MIAEYSPSPWKRTNIEKAQPKKEKKNPIASIDFSSFRELHVNTVSFFFFFDTHLSLAQSFGASRRSVVTFLTIFDRPSRGLRPISVACRDPEWTAEMQRSYGVRRYLRTTYSCSILKTGISSGQPSPAGPVNWPMPRCLVAAAERCDAGDPVIVSQVPGDRIQQLKSVNERQRRKGKELNSTRAVFSWLS